MKRWIFAALSMFILLASTACASTQEPSTPADAYDLAYDMQKYDHFADIFDENDTEEWENRGSYTMLLNGLPTPVVVQMDGLDVLAVRAYGHQAELGVCGAAFQGSTPVSIRSAEDAVVVNMSRDFDGETIILTEAKCFEFRRDGEISTQVYVREDGALAYGRYWGHYTTSFEHWDTAPLDLCTSRDQFLYETGHAGIRNGEVILTPEQTVTVSDAYDLDAMFARARESGEYAQYETVDELLAANQAGADES